MLGQLSQIVIILTLLLLCAIAMRPWLCSLPFFSSLSLNIVAASLGVLLGGLLFVLTVIFGIKSAWIAGLALVVFAVFSHRWRHRLREPRNLSRSSYISAGCQAILLIPFAGLILVVNFKMGLGEYPAVFVNMDTPLLLSHVFSLLRSDTYPPEELMTAGTFHAYHYGGAAAAAFVSAITGIAPHKAMFWVVNPLLALGAFFALLTLIDSAVSSRFQFIFAFCLFLPAIFLGNQLLSTLNADSLIGPLISNLLGDLFPSSYDPEAFARGVPGSSALSGYFLLLFATLLPLSSARRSFFLLATVIGTLAVFCKMDMMPGIFVILGIACIRHAIDQQRRSLFAFSHFLVFLMILPPLIMYVFGYFDGQASESAAMSIRTFEEITSHYDWAWNFARSFLKEQLIIIFLFLVLAFAVFSDSRRLAGQTADGLFIGLSAVAIAVATWILVAILEIPKTGYQLTSSAWISIPLVGLGLFMACKERLRLLPVLLMLPFAFIGLQGQIMKTYHAVVAIVLPEQVNEYADNRLIADALRHIPVSAEDWTFFRYVVSYPDLERSYKTRGSAMTRSLWGKRHYDIAGRREGRKLDSPCDELRNLKTSHFAAYVDSYPDLWAAYRLSRDKFSKEAFGQWHYTTHGQSEGRALPPSGEKSCSPRPMVVTNDFRFISWTDSQPQIPALFGHLAYGVHLRHFPGPRGFNMEGARRIDLQRALLSRTFTSGDPAQTIKTTSMARQIGWTHFLLRKDLDDQLPPVDAAEVPLQKIYENDRYAVFVFPL